MNKPTHPVDLIVAAFAAQEGWLDADPNVTPRLCNNPLDLRYAQQMTATCPGWDGKQPPPIATFPNPQSGIAAAYRQVWLWVQMGYSLEVMVYNQAPPNENNTAQYLANVTAWTGLNPNIPVKALLPLLVDVRTEIA